MGYELVAGIPLQAVKMGFCLLNKVQKISVAQQASYAFVSVALFGR